jgi:predicted DNA-binding ribbon-helix-helix protein
VSLEDAFWSAFRRMAQSSGLGINALAERIDAARDADTGLATAMRLAVLEELERQLGAAHKQAAAVQDG